MNEHMYSPESSSWHIVSALKVQAIIILRFHLGEMIENFKKESSIWLQSPGSSISQEVVLPTESSIVRYTL